MGYGYFLSNIREFWRDYRKDKRATVSLIIIVLISIIAYLAPFILSHDPMKMSERLILQPSAESLMGTDDLGRDVFTRTIYGARISLFVGATSSILSILVGVLVGSISGYFGGRVDNLLMRFTEMFLVIPQDLEFLYYVLKLFSFIYRVPLVIFPLFLVISYLYISTFA